MRRNIEAAEKIDIRKEAKLVGDIRTAHILIEDGAYLNRLFLTLPKLAVPAIQHPLRYRRMQCFIDRPRQQW